MASLVLTDCFVSLGGTDVSTYVRSVTLPYSVELLDDTTMGDTTRVNKPGLKVWQADIEFQNDFTDNLIDEILFGLVGTSFTMIVRPTSSAVSTSNPNYTGTGVMENYNPFGQSVGELVTSRVTIKSAGALSRATA